MHPLEVADLIVVVVVDLVVVKVKGIALVAMPAFPFSIHPGQGHPGTQHVCVCVTRQLTEEAVPAG